MKECARRKQYVEVGHALSRSAPLKSELKRKKLGEIPAFRIIHHNIYSVVFFA